MFEPLFARLSEHYHLVAPDYPGYGRSDWPTRSSLFFVAGNGFRTIGVIAALEEDLGRPVLTGNQIVF
jgi:pimeloyl-ACP methyl ester carboxylesterase